MDTLPIEIVVDADACPVKDEIYRVAKRYSLQVALVANVPLRVPAGRSSWVTAHLVSGRLDAADDWIADNISEYSIVVTTDIPLAARSLEQGAQVLDAKGVEFTDTHIGEALAAREINQQLRQMGIATGGPAPFSHKDRSQFLQTLDVIIQRLIRNLGN